LIYLLLHGKQTRCNHSNVVRIDPTKTSELISIKIPKNNKLRNFVQQLYLCSWSLWEHGSKNHLGKTYYTL